MSDADLASLRTEELTARIQRVQREGHVVAFAEAAARVFWEAYPDRPLPKSPAEIIEMLRDREPLPEAAARALAERRVGIARQMLLERAGIEGERLKVSPTPAPLGGEGEGRVEFDLDHDQ